MSILSKNSRLYLSGKSSDEGIFPGVNLSKIDENKTKEFIESLEGDYNGLFQNSILQKGNENQVVAEMTKEIPNGSTEKIGFFQPLGVNATATFNNKEYIVFGNYENGSGNTFASVEKMFVRASLNEDEKLKEVDLNDLVRFSSLKNAISDFMQIIINKGVNNLSSGELMFLQSVYTDNNLMKIGEDKQRTLSVNNQNILSFVDKIDNFVKNNDLNYSGEIKKIISDFNQNKDENIIMMNANKMFANYNDLKDMGIDIKSTKIDRYEVSIPSMDENNNNTLKIYKSNRSSEKINESVYKRAELITGDMEKDTDLYAKKAMDNKYVAHFFFYDIMNNAKNDLNDFVSIASKKRSGENLSVDDEAKLKNASNNLDKILAPLKEDFSSINYSGKFLGKNFVDDKPIEQKDFYGLLTSFRTKTNQAINADTVSNSIQLTKDEMRIKGNSNDSAIFYSGKPSKGTSLIEIEKAPVVKGTMGSELRLGLDININSISVFGGEFKDKEGKTVSFPPTVLAPLKPRTIDSELTSVLGLINQMKPDGNIFYDNSPKAYNARSEEKIANLAEYVKERINDSRYLKTKGFLTSFVNILDKNKSNPETLKEILNAVLKQDSKELKGLGATRDLLSNISIAKTLAEQTKYSPADSFKNGVVSFYSQKLNEALKENRFLNNKDDISPKIQRTLNQEIKNAQNATEALMQMPVEQLKAVINKFFENQNRFVTPMIGGNKENGFFITKHKNLNTEEKLGERLKTEEGYSVFIPNSISVAKQVGEIFKGEDSFHKEFTKIRDEINAVKNQEFKEKLKQNSFNQPSISSQDIENIIKMNQEMAKQDIKQPEQKVEQPKVEVVSEKNVEKEKAIELLSAEGRSLAQDLEVNSNSIDLTFEQPFNQMGKDELEELLFDFESEDVEVELGTENKMEEEPNNRPKIKI